MLREILAVCQDKPGLKRRWYQDDFFDLYTWHTRLGRLSAFQLCYDVRARKRALAWSRKNGFTHAKVDSGEENAGQPMTLLLVADGRFPHRLVRSRFERASTILEAGTKSFILDKMREFGRHAARGEIVMPRKPCAPKSDDAEDGI